MINDELDHKASRELNELDEPDNFEWEMWYEASLTNILLKQVLRELQYIREKI
jgi:hypothetical protein